MLPSRHLRVQQNPHAATRRIEDLQANAGGHGQVKSHDRGLQSCADIGNGDVSVGGSGEKDAGEYEEKCGRGDPIAARWAGHTTPGATRTPGAG